jgi:asparagine synthase (glutamine-hydrolysing)
MCGIAGALLDDVGEAQRAVARMCANMVARGPDDDGIETADFGSRTIVLGSRRLAIIDPSPAGHQPMHDPERATTIVFNGMIYNFRELRADLERLGERFRSNCDTEVVLRAYGAWGDSFVERLEGMFSVAVFDAASRRLVLARDRLGIKPLYYWRRGTEFAFASQVRAILASQLMPARLSTQGIASYLAFGAVQEPHTAIDGVHSLPPATLAVLAGADLSLSTYWEPPQDAVALADPREVEATLRRLLDESVERHLVSDRPVGVFLSGGVDSSALCALAAARHGGVRTLSVAFEEQALSEARFARAVADAVGSDHTEVTLTQSELRASLDGAFSAMDQPTFDGLNTYVVSRAAASAGLKVALSGLGADELFDGYGYVRRIELLERLARLPRPAARAGARAARVVLSGSRAAKAGAWLGDGDPRTPYELLRGLFAPAEVVRILPSAGANGRARAGGTVLPDELFRRVSVLDLTGYMRNVLLRDTDAMSMANSLEVRVPYLHDPLVDWVLRLPEKAKGRAKSLLVRAMRDRLPREVWDRPKHGFLLPIESWLRSDLGAEVRQTLSSGTPALDRLIDSEEFSNEWVSFEAGRTGWLRPWSLYAMCRWADEVGAR